MYVLYVKRYQVKKVTGTGLEKERKKKMGNEHLDSYNNAMLWCTGTPNVYEFSTVIYIITLNLVDLRG